MHIDVAVSIFKKLFKGLLNKNIYQELVKKHLNLGTCCYSASGQYVRGGKCGIDKWRLDFYNTNSKFKQYFDLIC